MLPRGAPIRHWRAATPAFRANGRPGARLYHGTWWDQWEWHQRGALDTVKAGRFTVLFPRLRPAVFDEDDLRLLADEMTSKRERKPAAGTGPDSEEDPAIPAAYTYLGQFADHDLTYDPTSSLRASLDRAQIERLAD